MSRGESGELAGLRDRTIERRLRVARGEDPDRGPDVPPPPSQPGFFGGASEDTPDKQGRVLLPAPLLQYGKLTKDVTVVGNNDHLEIWDRAAWAERLEGIEGSADHVAERLAAQSV